jgi:hypothetical protein
MERTRRRVRQIRMTDQRSVRAAREVPGLLGAALLVAALAGCASAAPAPAATATAAAAAAPQVGCASMNQATAATIRETTHVVAPTTSPAAETTYRQTAQVRALFDQLCAAVTHPMATMLTHCPDDIGTSYLGTFYDGSRALATFTYAASGCERVSVTAAGKTQSTMVYGRAAAAAPHLSTDLDVLVGTPKPGVMQPQGGVNPGGPDNSAQP